MTSHLVVRSCLFALAVTVAASSQELTEQEIIRRYLSGGQATIASLEVRATRADWQARTALPNPSLSFSREDVAGTRDQFLTLSQRLPITGRRSALKDAGSAATQEAESNAARRRQLAVADLRRMFHQAASSQSRLAALSQAQERVREIIRVLGERERAGESSGFDKMRAEHEAEAITARLAAERTNYLTAVSGLEAILGQTLKDIPLRWEAVSIQPPSTDIEGVALPTRPDYVAKKHQIDRLLAERRSAARTAIPEPTLSGGSKTFRSRGFDDTGYVATVGIDVPIFNRGQAEAARFKAEAERAQLELKLLESRIRAEISAALQRLSLQQSLAASTKASDDLGRIAQLSYDEGEASILELLDAYRVVLDSRLRTADVQLAVAEAQIDFDLAVGKEVQP